MMVVLLSIAMTLKMLLMMMVSIWKKVLNNVITPPSQSSVLEEGLAEPKEDPKTMNV